MQGGERIESVFMAERFCSPCGFGYDADRGLYGFIN